MEGADVPRNFYKRQELMFDKASELADSFGYSDISPEDTGTQTVAIIDKFSGEDINSFFGYGSDPHGLGVESVLKTGFGSRISRFEIKMVEKDPRWADLIAHEPWIQDSERTEISLLNARFIQLASNLDTLNSISKMKSLPSIITSSLGVPLIMPLKVRPETMSKWSGVEVRYRNQIYEVFDKLRENGVVIINSLGNFPTSSNKTKTEGMVFMGRDTGKFHLIDPYPGIFRVGGIEPAIVDNKFTWSLVGNPELSDLNTLGFRFVPDKKDVRVGNSYATPLAAIVIGIILNTKPELKDMSPRDREGEIQKILDLSSVAVDGQRYLRGETVDSPTPFSDKPDRITNYNPTKAVLRVLNVKHLKSNLKLK